MKLLRSNRYRSMSDIPEIVRARHRDDGGCAPRASMTCPARETTRVGRCGPERLSGTRTTRRIRVSGSIQSWGRRRRGRRGLRHRPDERGSERASLGRTEKVRETDKKKGGVPTCRPCLTLFRSRHRLRALSRHAHGPLRDAQEAPVHVLELDDPLPEAPHVRRVRRGSRRDGCFRCSRSLLPRPFRRVRDQASERSRARHDRALASRAGRAGRSRLLRGGGAGTLSGCV